MFIKRNWLFCIFLTHVMYYQPKYLHMYTLCEVSGRFWEDADLATRHYYVQIGTNGHVVIVNPT